MRQPLPRPSDYAMKPAEQFAPGSLVMVKAAPQGMTAQGGPCAPAVACQAVLSGTKAPALYLLAPVSSGGVSYVAGHFVSQHVDAALLSAEALGIEAQPVIEVDPLAIHVGVNPPRTWGALRIAAGGEYIETNTPDVRGYLDPATWDITTAGSRTWAGPFAPRWNLVWTTVSGVEVVVSF